MRSRNSKTDEQKAVASEQGKRHWRRCDAWAEVLGVTKEQINQHWSCCVCPNTKLGTTAVREKFSDHLRQKVLAERSSNTPKRSAVSLKPLGPVPKLDQRIKIMLWAIRKLGGPDNTRDALERAIRSLEDE